MSTLSNPGSYDWLRAMAACNSRCGDDDDAMGLVAAADTIHQLERENAALREAGHLAEKIIVQRTDEIRHLERENAALRQDKERLDWLDAVLMSVGEMGQPQMDGTRFSGQCRMNGRYRRVAGRSLRDFADAARAGEGGAA